VQIIGIVPQSIRDASNETRELRSIWIEVISRAFSRISKMAHDIGSVTDLIVE